MGDTKKTALGVSCNRSLKLEFQVSKVANLAGLAAAWVYYLVLIPQAGSPDSASSRNQPIKCQNMNFGRPDLGPALQW